MSNIHFQRTAGALHEEDRRNIILLLLCKLALSTIKKEEVQYLSIYLCDHKIVTLKYIDTDGYICIYIYICGEREREREREDSGGVGGVYTIVNVHSQPQHYYFIISSSCTMLSLYIYIYILLQSPDSSHIISVYWGW